MAKQNAKKYPFLWNFVIGEKISPSMSGAEERPFTKTVAEESSPTFVEIR